VLNVIMLNVIMLSVVMLSVVASSITVDGVSTCSMSAIITMLAIFQRLKIFFLVIYTLE
jgi:hypothetical protein